MQASQYAHGVEDVKDGKDQSEAKPAGEEGSNGSNGSWGKACSVGVACRRTASPTSPVCAGRRSQPVMVKMGKARGGHVSARCNMPAARGTRD